ncbi:MAG: hypothetical protein JKY37_34375 [Nannocystaceae bacterium]|nr:hypothetical protein [Nannocystaceae bacterium]
MTQDKDKKRLVRARMHKTGESYTAARAALTNEAGAHAPYTAPPSQWPALAGMSDSAVKAKTGRTWAQWVKALDSDGAHALKHREIAKLLSANYPEVGPWWTQTVTVGYERIRGLRDVQQTCDGTYAASKSRTFAVDVATLFKALKDPRRRKKWVGEGWKRIRTSTENRSIRVDWNDGTQVNFHFTAKGPAKSSVSLEHTKLATKADVEAAKALWTERFNALGDALDGG